MVKTIDSEEFVPIDGTRAPKPRFRNTWGRVLRVSFAVVLVVTLGLILWRVVDVQAQQRVLNAKLAALSAAGKPIDAAGVKRLHEERTSDELSAEWLDLFADLAVPELRMAAATLPFIGSLEGAANRVPLRGEDWESEAEARKFLSDTKAIRDRLRKLAVKGRGVYFPMQYEGEEAGSSEAHEGIAFATRMLIFEAFAALRYDAVAAAIEDVRCLFAMLRVLEGEPSSMSMAVCSSAEVNSLEVIKVAVQRSTLSEQQLAQLLEILQAYQPSSERFQFAIQGERGMLAATVGSLVEQQGLMYSLRGAPRFRTAALDLLDRLEAAPMSDLDGLVKVGSDVQSEIETLGFGNRGSADVMAPSALIPLTARASTIASREMGRRLAILAVALQMHRIKFGKLPAELAEVAKVGVEPAKLVPVGRKPFGYSVSDDGRSGTLWGFSLLSNAKQTPDEPPDVNDPLSLNEFWVWLVQ